MTVYVVNPQESTKKLLELVRDFSKGTEEKIIKSLGISFILTSKTLIT